MFRINLYVIIKHKLLLLHFCLNRDFTFFGYTMFPKYVFLNYDIYLLEYYFKTYSTIFQSVSIFA